MGQAATLSVHARSTFASGFVVAPDFDVHLESGSLLVLFGPSGAGKTTMLRQLAGLERPDAGRIGCNGAVWFDADRGTWVPPQQRRIGVVFQEATLFPHLSVAANIAYGVGNGGAASADTLRLLGIDHLSDRLPRTLSGGEAQRVALARALAPNPRLLLLDEPFASLDAPTRLRLRHDVRGLLTRTGTPAILVTHDRAERMAIGDRVAVVIDGRVRQLGPVTDVFSRPVDATVAAAVGVEAVLPARIAGSADGVLAVTVGETMIEVAEREPMAVGSDVFACIRAEDVTIETQRPAHASARNHLAARVVAITSEGPLERVSLDCGFPLDALITRQSRQALQLAAGSAVTAAIKAASVHLVARGW